MKTVRTGVIGAGVMGERHYRVCANLPRVESVGVADLNEERGRHIANRYETTYFSDHRALLSQLNAVTIATSTPTHYALAIECLEQGLHVMVEKPITETIEQAQQLVQMASECGLILQVGHIERFNPAFIELKTYSSIVLLSCIFWSHLPFFFTYTKACNTFPGGSSFPSSSREPEYSNRYLWTATSGVMKKTPKSSYTFVFAFFNCSGYFSHLALHFPEVQNSQSSSSSAKTACAS